MTNEQFVIMLHQYQLIVAAARYWADEGDPDRAKELMKGLEVAIIDAIDTLECLHEV